MSPDDIDLLLLTRDGSPPRQDVWNGIQRQAGVRLHLHRVIGAPRPGDRHRWETICRARNEGRHVGSSAWVMYLDDDVVLASDCLATLLAGLKQRPAFAAVAADSAGEMSTGWENWDYPGHVGMAATLFRREHLAGLTFRWEPGKCECWCCCDDLRRAGFAIGYLPGAIAHHNPAPRFRVAGPCAGDETSRPRLEGSAAALGRILTAFDRRDFRRFSRIFLPSLRAAGNREVVTAVVYGLYPSEQEALRQQPSVEVVAVDHNGVCPALRRLRDFQDVISRVPADTPVSYWDAGDIKFQNSLDPLWNLIRSNPNLLLVGREPLSFPENPVIRTWTNYIRDPDARQRAFKLMSTHRFLNSGFAAGTVGALLRYLREGDRLLNSPDLEGVGDWGDQPAMNLFCHTHPDAFQEIGMSWNFTLAGRNPREYTVDAHGRFHSTIGIPIHVVHGNAGSFRPREFPYLV
jgi:hypothetical protein